MMATMAEVQFVGASSAGVGRRDECLARKKANERLGMAGGQELARRGRRCQHYTVQREVDISL